MYDGGLIYGGADALHLLGVNAYGGAAIIAWSLAWSLVIFFPLNFFGMLR